MIKIGKLAKETNTTIDTLRYYERLGLLAPDKRSHNDYRLYDVPSAVYRVLFIKNAQDLGFTLSEIKKLLRFGSSKESTAADVLKMTKEKITTHEQKIDYLHRIHTVINELAEVCTGDGPASECPIINALYHDDNSKNIKTIHTRKTYK